MEPRIPTDAEVIQLLDFLNKNLRPQSDWSIADEYPLVFGPNNRTNLRVLVDQGKVVAHAAIKYHLIKNVLGLFKVAAIGSVVTDNQFRNQGYSQSILQNCLDSAEQSGADFAVLWTDLFDFYRKLDFELAGQEVSFVIDKNLSELKGNLKFLNTPQVSADAVSKLYLQHTVGSIRSLEEIKHHLKIPNSRVYTAWDSENNICAYAVEGKGADLDGYVHEWAGSVPHLMQLFTHIATEQNREIVVLVPGHSKNLINELSKKSSAHNGFLGMIRILHHENIFEKLHRYARQMGINDFVCEKQGDEYVIGRKSHCFRTTDKKMLTRLLFGPYDNSINVSNLDPILPIPMWIWGWDSV